MSIHLYLVTHDHIGDQLLKVAATIIDISDIQITTISIPSNITASQQTEYSDNMSASFASSPNNEKLILCDIYGATPCNLVKKLSLKNNTQIITGLNLGMLLKACSMTQKELPQAAQEIFQSAQKSIILD